MDVRKYVLFGKKKVVISGCLQDKDKILRMGQRPELVFLELFKLS